MPEPLSLGEYMTNFVFGFIDEELTPVELHPRIGRYSLLQSKYWQTEDGGIDFSTEEKAI